MSVYIGDSRIVDVFSWSVENNPPFDLNFGAYLQANKRTYAVPDNPATSVTSMLDMRAHMIFTSERLLAHNALGFAFGLENGTVVDADECDEHGEDNWYKMW